MNEIALEMPHYCVIPYEVISNKNLTPNAKIHYGCLAGLAKKEGYCWATDQQLAEMHGVNISQIKRWNKSLDDNGFIHRDTSNKPVHNRGEKLRWVRLRKIYINDGFSNKFYEKGKNEPSEKENPDSNKDCESVENDPTSAKGENERYKDIILKEEKEKEQKKDADALSSSSKTRSASPSVALRLSSLLFEEHRRIDPKFKKSNLSSWALDIDKLMRLDGREVADIEEMIKWVCEKSPFWRQHIQSGRSLRKNYSKLVAARDAYKPSQKEVIEIESQIIKKTIDKNKKIAREILGDGKFIDQDNNIAIRETAVEYKINGKYRLLGFLEEDFCNNLKKICDKIAVNKQVKP